jgi:hypothetical protein
VLAGVVVAGEVPPAAAALLAAQDGPVEAGVVEAAGTAPGLGVPVAGVVPPVAAARLAAQEAAGDAPPAAGDAGAGETQERQEGREGCVVRQNNMPRQASNTTLGILTHISLVDELQPLLHGKGYRFFTG